MKLYTFPTVKEATQFHAGWNYLAGYHDMWVIDGPEDNFAVVDGEQAAEIQDTNDIPECLGCAR